MEILSEAPRPFRWDLARRHRLGTLLPGPIAPSYDGFLDDLLRASARVIALCGDSDLYFIGRSEARTLEALRLAVTLFDHGTQRQTRAQFTALLAEQPAMRHGWLQSLVLDLKRESR